MRTEETSERGYGSSSIILDQQRWGEVFKTINLWIAALIRCGLASRYELDCVLDAIMERLQHDGVVRDSDYALELLKRTMDFAFFAGKCFADREKAAEAGANSAPSGMEKKVYRLVLKNFSRNGRVNGVEYRILSFMDVYTRLPAVPPDRKTLEKRRQALKDWDVEKSIVPEID